MRRVSLTQRKSLDAPATDEIEVVLVKITHPDLGQPVRLSTDPTVRLSADPLTYCTYSRWLTDDGSPFLFILMEAILPGDQRDAPHAATLVLQLVDNDLSKVLRMTTQQARVDIAVVLATSLDIVEAEYLDLRLTGVEGDAGEAQLSISRDPLTSEPWPAGRMTKRRFPGLHP